MENYASDKNKITKLASKEISIIVILVVYNKMTQTVIPKSMIPDPGWFDDNQMKFEDQQREIQLFLKSNRVIAKDNKITVILA